MTKPIAILIACLVLNATSTEAYATATMGVQSCTKWLLAREARATGAPEALQYLFLLNWVSGFLTGYAISSGKDFLADTDLESIPFLIDKACRDNPQKNLAFASSAVGTLLMIQRGMKP